MKSIIVAVISLVPFMTTLLAFQHTSLDVFAISDYKSGYMHGVHDGSPNCEKSDKCVPYVLQPGKGFIIQTKEFRDGYITGYCSVPGNENNRSDVDEAGWDCKKGPSSANWLTANVVPQIVGLPTDLTVKVAARAIQNYDKVLAIDPNEKHALSGKANALYNQSNYTQAIQYYDRVLDLDPGDKNALNGKGNALFNQGNYTQAIQYYDKALTIDPKDSNALKGKGDVFYSLANDTQGDERAIQYYDKALAVEPSSVDALSNKGSAFDRLGSDLALSGNYTQAFQYYDKALAINPNDTYSLNGMGNVLYTQGNNKLAIQYYDKSLDIDPNDTYSLERKGDALYSLANDTQGYENAIQYYDKALAVNSNDTYALNGMGNVLYTQGNYTQAVESYDKALAVDPTDKVILDNKANALASLGNYTQAIQSFNKALAIDPNYRDALNGKGDALRGQGNYTQALQYFDNVLAIDPKDPTALNGKVNTLDGKGDALHYQGNYTQSIQYYDKALAIDANDTYALDGIGKVFADQSNYTKSIQYYDKALAVNSTDPGALFEKQNAISKIVESGNTSGYDRGCIDAQIPNPSERYIHQSIFEPNFHSNAFMKVYKEGFDACSGNLSKRVETLKMFNVIVLKGNVTDETANTRICTTVSEGGPQTVCQNLDNLKPENNSNSIESKVFTFENVPVNASFHSCIQRLIYPNVTICDNYGSKNYQGPTVEQKILPFFGVDPAAAEDDEGYTSCPTYLTEVQCYGKIVNTPDDGYDVNDTSIDQASKQIASAEQLLPAGSLTANQIQASNKPIVTNQTVTLKEGANITLRGIYPNNKSLNFSIYTEPGKGTITFTKINSTSVNATYFPLEDGILTDSFSYKASNGISDSNIGKVVLTFFPPQTSDNGNASSDIQSQSPVNQSSPEEQLPGNTESNQTEPSAEYYKGLDWWGICNNSLVRLYISQTCETLVSPGHRALTSQGKIVLEGILCPKGPSILSTIELFYGPIPGKAKNELSIACGWQIAR